MLQSQVDSMKQTVERLKFRTVVPKVVSIKREHAEYLKVPFTGSDAINPDKPKIAIPGAVQYGSVVKVKLVDLVAALKTAKGTDAGDAAKTG